VVKPSNERLYNALKSAFDERHGFTVIQDRRAVRQAPRVSDERRKAEVWEADDLLIAEESDDYSSL
jgi:hypothetical protein